MALVMLLPNVLLASMTCTCTLELTIAGKLHYNSVATYTTETHCGDRNGVQEGGIITSFNGEYFVDSTSGTAAFDACNN